MRTLLPLSGAVLAALQTCAPPAVASHVSLCAAESVISPDEGTGFTKGNGKVLLVFAGGRVEVWVPQPDLPGLLCLAGGVKA